MIKEVTMYTVICDNCGSDSCSGSEYSCWSDKSYAHEIAMESDWQTHEGKDYCPYCISLDDEDNIVVDQTRAKCTPTK